MQASYDLPSCFQAFTQLSIQPNSLNKTAKFSIDKNLCLKLVLKSLKGALLFHGTFLYRNGLELKLNQKSWRLVSQYSQLKINNLLFVSDLSQKTVKIRSKILFPSHLIPSDKFISEHTANILKQVKSFTSTLYRYHLLNFSNKFSFSQFLEEAKLKKKLCSQLRYGNLADKIYNTHHSDKSSQTIDKKKEAKPSSNIQQCFIKQCRVEELQDIPQKLQGGPKNVHFNFPSDNPNHIVSGGFFQIQKLLCSIQNFYINSDKSNLKSVGQNGSVTGDNFGCEKSTNIKNYDILVRKTLKQAKRPRRQNRMKISKELIIVQQIKQKKHLLTYYKNQLNPAPGASTIASEPQEASRDSMVSESMPNEEINLEMEQQNQNNGFKQEEEIYMEFHAHTLKDFIGKQRRSLDEILNACLQLLEATVDLHQSGVIHRDIKPENVLMDYETHRNNLNIKLIDFAESAIHTESQIDPQLYQSQKQAISQIFEKFYPRLYGATLPYSPPECQSQRSDRNSPGINSFKIDSWSMGMILPEVFHGKRLINFPRPYADDIISLIKDSALESHFSRVNKKGFDIGQALITYIGMKNTFYNPGSRLDVMRSYNAFMILNEKMGKWQRRIRKESSKHRFQYSKV